MVFLKSIFSIYIGTYLILPGCVCQILAPLGIEVLHAPPDGSVDPKHSGPPLATLTLPVSCPTPVDCNCDDTTLKSAEQCVASYSLYQQDIFKITTRCPWADLNALSLSSPNPSGRIGSRAPPDFQRSYTLKRPAQMLFGVILV